MSILPDLRAPLEGSTPGGARVRLRPAVAAGRWICDVWGPDGALVFGGRPLAAGADLLSIAGLGEGLEVRGDVDPDAAASLAAQGISIVAT